MKWEGNRESDNVEDRRSGGGGGGLLGGRSIGIGTIVIALVGGWIFGINPMTILSLLSGGTPTAQVQQGPAQRPPADDRMASFVSTVLADTEDVWKVVFTQGGSTYQEPRLVLFRGATATACGQGQAAMGPFYCPADQKVYIDLGFYETLQKKLGAPGDFAQAYVIAHEVGHHVQNLLGVLPKARAEQRAAGSKVAANRIQVRVELQADCFAGIWASRSEQRKQFLDPGDIDAALQTATAIGDDTLQRNAGQRPMPHTFTHGTSEQRSRWFMTGLQSGQMADCDTFWTDAL